MWSSLVLGVVIVGGRKHLSSLVPEFQVLSQFSGSSKEFKINLMFVLRHGGCPAVEQGTMALLVCLDLLRNHQLLRCV